MTKKEAVRKHRKMWKWIAEKTRQRKRCVDKNDYMMEVGAGEPIYLDCFCCHFDSLHEGTEQCESCPLCWESDALEYMCEYATQSDLESRYETGIYAAWRLDVKGNDWQHAAEMADIIAILAETED